MKHDQGALLKSPVLLDRLQEFEELFGALERDQFQSLRARAPELKRLMPDIFYPTLRQALVVAMIERYKTFPRPERLLELNLENLDSPFDF